MRNASLRMEAWLMNTDRLILRRQTGDTFNFKVYRFQPIVQVRFEFRASSSLEASHSSFGVAPAGRVASSSHRSQASACSRLSPHISVEGLSPPQQRGRSGWSKIAQRKSSVSWLQRVPAGLPFGMPGIGVEMDRAIQQAPHPGRHSMSINPAERDSGDLRL